MTGKLSDFSPPALLRAIFDEAVRVADPMIAVPKLLPEKPAGRVLVIGAGKATARMAEAVESLWGPCDGLVITRYGYARPLKGIECVEAAHPVPDAAGVAATERMLTLLDTLGADDFVLCLISGGGSALLSAPAQGLGLSDLQTLNAALLASGAPIGDMNVIRKHFSRVKGGQLAARCHPARMLCLMISDVPGDDPADIASGPTVGEKSTANIAHKVLRHHNISLPAPMIEALGNSTVVSPDDPRLATVENHVIAAPFQSLEAASAFAQTLGVTSRILGDAMEGEARDIGREQAVMARMAQAGLSAEDTPLLLLSGGECTVTGKAAGVGGPNAEFALSAAIELKAQAGIYLLACDTDGVDGAAEIAGAIVCPDTLAKANEAGLDAQAMLDNNDSHTFFAGINGQVVTGPTLTNVNDFRAFLIYPRHTGRH